MFRYKYFLNKVRIPKSRKLLHDRALKCHKPCHKTASPRGPFGKENEASFTLSILSHISLELLAEFLHVKPGKGSAFVRSKLKNYITNNTVDKTFRAGESVEAAEVDKRTKQYTYNDGDQLVFMDMVRADVSCLSNKRVSIKWTCSVFRSPLPKCLWQRFMVLGFRNGVS